MLLSYSGIDSYGVRVAAARCLPVYSRHAECHADAGFPAVLNYDRDEVAAALPYAALVDALHDAFRGDFATPTRAHHTVPVPGSKDATLLLMPSWQPGKALGVKIASVFPGNADRGMPSVNATYLMLDPQSGEPRAVLDGGELTLRRTAAASALASRYLSRADAATLLMVGTGRLAPHMIAAHAAVRPIRRVLVWGRDRDKAAALAARVAADGIDAAPAESVDAALAEADVVSCATLSSEPLVRGAALRPGQHVDLVGAYHPGMREADDEALRRARLFVDTRAGALAEAGELVQGIRNGAIAAADVVAELAELASGARPGRLADADITLFKSVGCALEDLVAARLVCAAGSAR